MGPSTIGANPSPPDGQRRISKSHFKAHALELFRQVEASGEPLLVTDHGCPSIEVRPYRPPNGPAADPLEQLRGSVLRFDDPFEPACDDNWDALR
ncbi:MAG: type II toxin-antitoxin system Phd/YefM family antitoxin [Cyanobium sp.]